MAVLVQRQFLNAWGVLGTKCGSSRLSCHLKQAVQAAGQYAAKDFLETEGIALVGYRSPIFLQSYLMFVQANNWYFETVILGFLFAGSADFQSEVKLISNYVLLAFYNPFAFRLLIILV